jgi:hypothetical protein
MKTSDKASYNRVIQARNEIARDYNGRRMEGYDLNDKTTYDQFILLVELDNALERKRDQDWEDLTYQKYR